MTREYTRKIGELHKRPKEYHNMKVVVVKRGLAGHTRARTCILNEKRLAKSARKNIESVVCQMDMD